ncbi:TetR/AcrR family transcriptional regulator, partial [candidate division FCPU426 bacterium]|nr:TetR/AcrR family transcriptional regulator [candidate division FCPU426 bacterium]
ASASALFIKHGTRRITIEEICKTANVSKVTFYKFFKNKVDIVKAVVRQIYNEAEAQYRAIMAAPVSYREKVERVLQMKIKASREYSDDFIRDLMELDAEIRAYIMEQYQKNLQYALEMLEQGKREKVIRADLNPDFYVLMLGYVNEMFKDERFKKIFPDSRKRTEELVKFWFYGMFDAIG